MKENFAKLIPPKKRETIRKNDVPQPDSALCLYASDMMEERDRISILKGLACLIEEILLC